MQSPPTSARATSNDPHAVEPMRDWHAMEAGEVVERFDSSSDGLPADVARARLQEFGPNQLPAPPRRSPIVRFLVQFHNALIYFLMSAAVAAAVLGHFVDAAVIVAVVVINAIVGFMQEGKAERALDAIRRMIAPVAHVRRDGERVGVPVVELVPGDIVLLEAGDRVPADMRLLRAKSLLIDEAILTGESVASAKRDTAVAPDAPLGDRDGMAFSSTLVVSGQGVGVVTATGAATEIGQISRLIGEVETVTTPLLRQINSFGRRITWVAIAGAVLLFAFAVLVRGFVWDEALIAVVALAVGLVPEGLPAVITITLAIGVQRMASRNAVIRRLPAVETLGATSVICSDKTGTLTRNEMTVRQLATAGHRVVVSGSGYAPQGNLSATGDDDDAAAESAVLPLIRAGLLCNDARVRQDDGAWSVDGDPMEGALLVLAMKAGLDPDHLRSEWPRLDEIPFDAQHRFMATLHAGPAGQRVIVVKGAPERLLEMCAVQTDGSGTQMPLDQAAWESGIADFAGEGERVLGFAWKKCGADASGVDFDSLEQGLEFVGIMGFIDPPRDEAVAAIAECHLAGVSVKMITGDHAATAEAIARQLGLAEAPRVVTGAELESVDDADLGELARETSVFARTNPEHKLRIVRALQGQGAVVAMTGDGVNDAPALKQADVGVAMGCNGTEAAKEASEMVLLDDNFASIVAAVHEGRVVYDNIRKVVGWTLPTNGGEVLAVVLAIVVGFAMPMTPVQILWINLVLTVTLGLVLAFEPAEAGVMRRPPRRASASLMSPFLLWRVVFVSLVFLVGVLAVFGYAHMRGYSIELARTMVVNALVVMEIFYLFNVRYLHMSSFSLRGAMGTRAVLAAIAAVALAQLAFTYLPVMQRLFETRPVSLFDGVLILALGALVLVVLEVEKAVLRRLGVFEELQT